MISRKNRRLRRGSNFPISYYFPSLLPRIFIISPSSIPILTSFIPFSLWGDFFLLPSTLENTSLMRSPASKYGVHIKTDRITSGFRKYGVLLIIMGFTQNGTLQIDYIMIPSTEGYHEVMWFVLHLPCKINR